MYMFKGLSLYQNRVFYVNKPIISFIFVKVVRRKDLKREQTNQTKFTLISI